MNSQARVSLTHNSGHGALLLVGAAWILSYFLARYLLDAMHPAPHWDILVANIPTIVFFGFVWSVQSTLRKADELRRRIHLEALAMAFLTVMLAVMVVGLLEDSPGGHLWLPLRDLWFAFPLLYGVCFAVATRHYR